MTDLPALLREKIAPDRGEAVLGQAVPFNPETWKRWLPEGLWPDELDLLQGTGKFHRITRDDVFRLSADVDTPAQAVQCYVAACVWGTGAGGIGVARRSRPLHSRKDAGDRLLESMTTLREDGAVAAYRRLQKGGDTNLRGLGPAFFTKVLYFAGWDAAPGPRPLILDRFVVRAFNEQAELTWRTNWTWTRDQYALYLDTVARWASSWATTADVVERQLFDHGKTLSARR
ncbi:hypothetical protein GCM10010413_15420 [Promicromonospora sukumoe]|uniref:HhH-GPD family protein n=1 Tax=Promicromonospora sukumoe TaxID=88382 RepID=A0A7W3PF43_9MICO|nr:hypothetical protein [Promicromonospora sukumoe]MBA8809232.1 hypothetical protein [Promicromonospora sukumoe]